ncbi:NBS resistance-like protein [Hibiscus syriacus]|uniref:NBS resistance-like protein n=1 Tax=Hibiscus syriacus TaxID=106335 RepID=A0A6A3AC29_HIBSY|nr:uncharacterized protein LOC120129825 [Hibiscus syriacus]KAE8702050.1 NBS resistance-like protein [Hibiscus syriacus]
MGEHIANDIQVLHEDKLVEEEEALSLSDLPLDVHTKTNPTNELWPNSNQTRTQKSSLESTFEFLNDEKGSDMCPADDIISGGKLVPFGGKTTHHVQRKRSESLSELRSSSAKHGTALLRISRSLDSQKKNLRRSGKKEKSSDQSEASPKKVVKPRWYVLVFGSVKFPPEMELRDIKIRQVRRNPPVMFSDDGKKVADNNNRSSDKSSSSWGLLKALSCRDYTSIAVTSSFYLPQA